MLDSSCAFQEAKEEIYYKIIKIATPFFETDLNFYLPNYRDDSDLFDGFHMATSMEGNLLVIHGHGS